jgi:hypothetical protein
MFWRVNTRFVGLTSRRGCWVLAIPQLLSAATDRNMKLQNVILKGNFEEDQVPGDS